VLSDFAPAGFMTVTCALSDISSCPNAHYADMVVVVVA